MAETTDVWAIKVKLKIDDVVYTRYLSKLSLEGTTGYIDGSLEFGTIDDAIKEPITGYRSMTLLRRFTEHSIGNMPYVKVSMVSRVPYQPTTDSTVYFHKRYVSKVVRNHPELNHNFVSKIRSTSLRAIDAIEIGGLLWNVYEVDPLNGIYRLLCTDEDLIELVYDYELSNVPHILQKVDELLQRSPDYDKLMWSTNPAGTETRKVSLCNYFPYQCGCSILPSNFTYWGVYGEDEKPIRIYPRETGDDIRAKCMVPAAFDYDLSGTAFVVPSIAVKLPMPEPESDENA